MTAIEFTPWPKTARLFRDCIITEKIDGTNAAIGITEDGAVYAQSRNRIITPDADNFGFARWVALNAHALAVDLGFGLHFGEWWGQGIQRGYGLTEKRFSLFNTHRFGEAELVTPGLHVVPVLYVGRFKTSTVDYFLGHLAARGSVAAPGFAKPEGVCVYHTAAGITLKALIENDQLAKSDLRNAA